MLSRSTVKKIVDPGKAVSNMRNRLSETHTHSYAIFHLPCHHGKTSGEALIHSVIPVESNLFNSADTAVLTEKGRILIFCCTDMTEFDNLTLCRNPVTYPTENDSSGF